MKLILTSLGKNAFHCCLLVIYRELRFQILQFHSILIINLEREIEEFGLGPFICDWTVLWIQILNEVMKKKQNVLIFWHEIL